MQLLECTDQARWDDFVVGHTYGHPLQLWGWGEVKKANGWTAHRLYLEDDGKWLAAAEVLTWAVPGMRSRVGYVPRGPVADPDRPVAKKMLEELGKWARDVRVMYLRVEPDWQKFSFGQGWVKSKHHLEMFETYRLDLSRNDEELMAAMSRKHRQYIRQSERNGVIVKVLTEGDLNTVYDIYAQTAKRVGFGLHDISYYERVRAELGKNGYLLVAEFEGKQIAFLWMGMAGRTAYELYGGMDDVAAKMHANYLLKWRSFAAMRDAGYQIYDFNGRVTEGVSNFKAGFGPEEIDLVGSYDFPVNKLGYQMWEKLWPVAKPVGRQILRLRRGGQS